MLALSTPSQTPGSLHESCLTHQQLTLGLRGSRPLYPLLLQVLLSVLAMDFFPSGFLF